MRTGSPGGSHAAHVARLRAKVGVDTPVGHWVVHYTDKDGKDCESCVGLGVPRSSLIGEPLTEEQKMEAARQVLMRARRDWNNLDCSGEDLLQV